MALKIRGNTQILGGSIHNEQLKEANVSLSKLAVITDTQSDDGNYENEIKIAAGKSLKFTDENRQAALTISADGHVTVAGNLNVTGSVDHVDTQNLLVEDFTITVAKSAATDLAASNSGIKFGDSALGVNFLYNGSKFESSKDIIAGSYASTNYLTSVDSLHAADVALDAAIKSTDSAMGARVTLAEGRITANEGDIVALENADSAMGDRVTLAEGRITANEGDIVSLENADSAMGDRVSLAEGRITANEGDIVNLQIKDSALQDELDNTQTGAGLEGTGLYSAYTAYNETTAPNGAHYISSATSLKDADKLLDAQLKTLESNISSGAISGGALEMKIGTVSGGLMGNFVSKSEHFEINDNNATSVTLSEVVADHSAELEELVMVFINGQKLRSKADGVVKDYDFDVTGTHTVIDFAGSIDLESQDDVEVIYFSKV